jgi:hypothetical protein
MSNNTVTIASIKNETEVPAVVIDAQGIITFVNKCCIDLFRSGKFSFSSL